MRMSCERLERCREIKLLDVVRCAIDLRDSALPCPFPSGGASTPPDQSDWTSADGSRLINKVREELARRRQQQRENGGDAPSQSPLPPTASKAPEAGLFGQTQTELATPEAAMRNPGRRFGRIAKPRAHTDIRALVEACYRSLMRPLPEEHVILNPLANAEFIVRCRDLGTTAPEAQLNWTLLNNRKAGRHADVTRKAAPRMSAGAFDRIGHAVEMAASLVQRERCKAGWSIPSVDDMLCDPEQRTRLGNFVRAFHGNVEPIDCHLVLLAIRKSGKEASTRAAGASLPQRTLFAPLRSLDPSDVPEMGGLYRFLCGRQPVFVGSSISLRSRIRGHLQNGGNRLLPDSLPFQIDGPIHLEVFELPPEAPKADYVALSRSLRLREDPRQMRIPPDLNWREKGALFPSKSNIVACEAMAS